MIHMAEESPLPSVQEEHMVEKEKVVMLHKYNSVESVVVGMNKAMSSKRKTLLHFAAVCHSRKEVGTVAEDDVAGAFEFLSLGSVGQRDNKVNTAEPPW